MFIYMQKINFIPPFFFEILKRYYMNLLFWILWDCLAMTSKNDTATLIFIFIQKIIFIAHLFLQILQLFSKIFILGTLGMSGHTH